MIEKDAFPQRTVTEIYGHRLSSRCPIFDLA